MSSGRLAAKDLPEERQKCLKDRFQGTCNANHNKCLFNMFIRYYQDGC